MNKIIFALIILMFVTSISWVYADEQQNPPINKSNQLFLNGEIIAAEISKATGCAISPILGISVLGAYTYYTTPVEQRAKVPWHAKPTFWGPLLVVLLGIILKDSSKIVMPKIIIMPLDAIETLLEKNASAALGLLVILSSITGKGIEQMQLSGEGWNVSLTSTAYAANNISVSAISASSGTFELGILSILVTLVFTLVWVVSQSFNFLMFLCPFSWLDLMLLFFKNAIIALLVGTYLSNPFLGLFVSCLIILISIYLFARSYRFVIFGTIISADILFKKSRRQAIQSEKIKVFASSTLNDVPSLSYGTLSVQNSTLTFHYKPWLFMPQKRVTAKYSCDQCNVGIGTLSPVIICKGEKFDTYMTLFRLRPLYQSHEKRIAELLRLKEVRDVTIGKTLKDGFNWLKEQIGLNAATHRAEP